jgi:ubiquinone/menaquinone biosynthesis C-methylase UbiE
VGFAVAAGAYDRFIGRYSVRLAPSFADFAGIAPGNRVLDVGCGPGALTTELVRRLGVAAVAAVDPSEQFAAAASARHIGIDVRVAAAEELPFADAEFDAAFAQLVVHFMNDPVRGLAEMARVTRNGGALAACVWDHAGGQTPLAPFWHAVHELDPNAADESSLAAGTRAISPSCAPKLACATSRRLHYRSPSSTPPSRNGGSRSLSALVPRAPT